MGSLAQSFRFAFRQVRKTPGFTSTVVLTLALGIGATTSIFSLVEGILLRPLPFSDPDRLVILGDHLGSGLGTPGTPVTAREIGTYAKATNAFSSMGGYIGVNYELSGSATPEVVFATRFTAGVFPTLGVRPILGRVFTQEEEDGHLPMAVIGYALWLSRYRRDPNILGSSIVLDRKAYSIIGVMPRGFEFPPQPGHLEQAQLWVPMSLTPGELSDENAGNWGYHMIARLEDSVTLPQAAKDADRVSQQIMRDFPANVSRMRIQGDVTPLREYVIANVRTLLRTLLFAVAIVLLIACVNVSGMLLVRAIRRRREYAVRLALGAGSGVIIREAVCEGLLLSLAGGALGLAGAAVVIRTAVHLLPQSMPRINSISLDASVAVFALLLALGSGACCSVAPAFAALQTNLIESLKEGISSATGSRSHSWLRSALMVSEIAIALVLLTVAGAFLRSFQKMRAVDPGFRPEQVLVAHFQLPRGHASAEVFDREVVDRLSRQPAIIAAGIANAVPATGSVPESGYTVEGVSAERWKLEFAAFEIIYGDYFRAMDIPLLEGRTFSADDRSNAPPVVIVNQSMARHSWPDQSAIGKRMHAGNPSRRYPWATVVGVVADTKLGSRDEPSIDQWYSSALQPAVLGGSEDSTGLPDGYVTVRSALPPEQLVQILRSTIGQIDPLLALQNVQPMSDALSNEEAPRRFNTDLITAFALGALLLALTGIYAVVAFSVSQRAHEIAIRLALGAPRARITRLILFSVAKLAFLGCSLGILGSLAVSRFVRSFLFEVRATDPFIYMTAALTMILLALLASALPATRAASADPIDALRSM
jgi:putative ABC transport system permease protein